jgi:hypothetical protein
MQLTVGPFKTGKLKGVPQDPILKGVPQDPIFPKLTKLPTSPITSPITECGGIVSDRINGMNTISSKYSSTAGIHPVTAGRCAEKGKKLIDNYEGVWDILEERS